MATGRNRWFSIQRSAEHWELFLREAKTASEWIKNPLRLHEERNDRKSVLEMNELELYKYLKKK